MAFDERELCFEILNTFVTAQKLGTDNIAGEERFSFCHRQGRRVWSKPTKAPRAPKPPRERPAKKGDPRMCPCCGARSKSHRCAAFKRVAVFDQPPRRPPDKYRYVPRAPRAKGAEQ